MDIPENLLYTKEHEWVSINNDTVTVGITDYAQNELGEIVFVELPKVGDKTKANESFGVIEAVKTVADMFAPVTGEITEVNDQLEDHPELINKEPFDKGWIIKVRFQDKSEIDSLLSPADYSKMIS